MAAEHPNEEGPFFTLPSDAPSAPPLSGSLGRKQLAAAASEMAENDDDLRIEGEVFAEAAAQVGPVPPPPTRRRQLSHMMRSVPRPLLTRRCCPVPLQIDC